MGRSLLDHPRPEGSGWRHVLAGRLDAWAHRSFVASLIVGGLVSLVYCVHLGSRIRFSDEGEYLRLAAQLSQHGRYSLDGVHATAFRPPGYPFLLGAARVVGVPVGALRSLNVLFFLVVIGASWWLANRIAGGAAACIAAPLVALNPVSIYVVGSLYPETMGSAILLTALVALVASRDSTHPLRLVVTSGMLFGLLIVTIPTFAFVVALVAVWLAVLKARRQAVVVILTALLLPAAWTGRNAAVMHTLAPVSTNGGLNLLLGNSPVTGPRSGVTADLSPYYRYAKAHHLGEVASDAYFRSSALHWIGAHPASAAVLYLENALPITSRPSTGWPRRRSPRPERTSWPASSTYHSSCSSSSASAAGDGTPREAPRSCSCRSTFCAPPCRRCSSPGFASGSRSTRFWP